MIVVNKLTKLKNQLPIEYYRENMRIIRKQNELPEESRTKFLNDLITTVEIGIVLSFRVEKKIILTYMQDLQTTSPKAYRNSVDLISELGIVE
jgi:hypothetical protein